jgi:hypothetical protein
MGRCLLHSAPIRSSFRRSYRPHCQAHEDTTCESAQDAFGAEIVELSIRSTHDGRCELAKKGRKCRPEDRRSQETYTILPQAKSLYGRTQEIRSTTCLSRRRRRRGTTSQAVLFFSRCFGVGQFDVVRAQELRALIETGRQQGGLFGGPLRLIESCRLSGVADHAAKMRRSSATSTPLTWATSAIPA